MSMNRWYEIMIWLLLVYTVLDGMLQHQVDEKLAELTARVTKLEAQK